MPDKDALKAKVMKRVNGLWGKIISPENLRMADAMARKGKRKQRGIIEHDKNKEANIMALHSALRDKTYRTSKYVTFPVYEPKERIVFKLPYYPDRIVHWAVMLVLEPIFVSMFTADTYSCIKGKGIHGALRAVKAALRDEDGTRYCLKLDVTKFYPSVNHTILKRMLRRKFKDQNLLWLLDEIIDSADGLPIGNFLSQFLANFYLTSFDHWMKEAMRVKDYFRYSDDIVVFDSDKRSLHQLLAHIREYFWHNLKLIVKSNYQIFPIAPRERGRGLDFIGYVFYHTHILMRKSIKQRFARMISRRPKLDSIASYYGWACHANCNHLLKTLFSNEKFQRLRNQADQKRLYRRQNKDGQGIKCTDNSTCV